MSKIIFNLPDHEAEDFKRFSHEIGSSMSHLLRQWVRDALGGQVPCGITTSGGIASGYLVVVRGLSR